MSSHLRHCPKHRKPLPCAHCALMAKPATVAENIPIQPTLVVAPVAGEVQVTVRVFDGEEMEEEPVMRIGC